MPSRLRYQESFVDTPAEVIRPTVQHASLPSQKKSKMSLSQTYYVASSARSKLGREAGRPDHNLRRLVGHANLLDSLMLELQDAEREQEKWFNQTVKKAQKTEEPKHIQWADTIVEEADEEDDSDSDSDSEYDESEFLTSLSPRRIATPPVLIVSPSEAEDEEQYYDDMEDAPELALVRTHSHSPPELVDDSDSDDETPPASPPQPTIMDFDFDEKTAMQHREVALFDDQFLAIPERNAPLIATLV